ncbi:PH domain-containing protein [Bacillus sp. PS06]|uniref:PH domain-containing protein n=1 Tax=Bacillus sp. PS06 TaxID=2764176 RepID=UPI00177BC249|nr:PH domain-containing protein [Bacillus sp. PS06]MBD8069677.1 PH domain-containing protein [Bacillus sp. PS06]
MREAPRKQISKRALPAWRISATISSAVGWLIVIGAFIMNRMFDWPFWLFLLLLSASIIETIVSVFIIPNVRWKRWRYEVFEHEVEIQQGVFVVKRTIIPMMRVQHVDTKQGPILRAYDLASVTISTAATVHEIPALDLDEADELRDFISRLARVDDDV